MSFKGGFMRLNNQGKEEIRAYFSQKENLEKLLKLPEGKRIHLDCELLEELIFERVTIDNEMVKYPIWSGECLKKIDLSEVSFENVSWNLISRNLTSKLRTIDLSGTNARIDFSKSYEAKNNKPCTIACVDFSHMDLTDAHLEVIDDVYRTNFSSCEGDFISLIMGERKILEGQSKDLELHRKFTECQFRGLNLSTCSLSLSDFCSRFINCDFRGTSLSIGNFPDILGENQVEILSKNIQGGRLNHCYVNGVHLATDAEKEVLKSIKEKEYEEYKKKIKSKIDTAIQSAM